jgi:hypothetical protein
MFLAGDESLVNDGSELEVCVEVFPPYSLTDSANDIDIVAVMSKSLIGIGCFVRALT